MNDKESSQFFFPGICWERSFIPLDIWNAGDSNSNLIESVHSDVNREGVHCTLLGGLQKGRLFDALKMKTLNVSGVLVFNVLLKISGRLTRSTELLPRIKRVTFRRMRTATSNAKV